MVDSTGAISQNSLINYEISKTIEKVIEGSGNIKQLSVATVVNDVVREVEKEEGVIEIISEPRTPEQMQKLEQIVINAVGVKEERNDQISTVNIPFETNNYEYGFEDTANEQGFSVDNIDQYFNYFLIILAIVAALFILKGLMGRLKNEKILIGSVSGGGGGSFDTGMYADVGYSPEMEAISQTALETPAKASKRKAIMPAGDLEDEISDEAARRRQRQEKISNYVAKNPMDAAKLINSWLHEDEF
jgi:flagellar M-ring protein FliF